MCVFLLLAADARWTPEAASDGACVCDNVDDHVRTQYMTLSYDTQYPISELCAGDTGDSQEIFNFRLEPLSCEPGEMCIENFYLHATNFAVTGGIFLW